MKSAAVFLRPSPANRSDKSPALFGTVYIPASLVMELAQALQANQYDHKHTDTATGEPRFGLNVSLWQESDPSKGYVLSGRLESPSERAAYLAAKAQTGVTGAQGPAWGAPRPESPHQAAIAPTPAAPPAPAARPAPPAWGAPAAGGWG